MAFTFFFNHIIFGQVTIDMSKEVSNSQEETTCDDSLNVGFDDCFTDVSSMYVQANLDLRDKV